MTAMLLSLGMALGTSAMTEVPGKERFQLDVKILKGDPLGSREEGNLKHLSEPRIQVLSNVTASFFTGGEHPYTGPSGMVEYVPLGIGLKLRPKLQDNGEILLHVEWQNTEVAPGEGRTDSSRAHQVHVGDGSNVGRSDGACGEVVNQPLAASRCQHAALRRKRRSRPVVARGTVAPVVAPGWNVRCRLVPGGAEFVLETARPVDPAQFLYSTSYARAE